MATIVKWEKGEVKQRLYQYLKDAKENRQRYEDRWRANEYIVFNTGGANMDDLIGKDLEKQSITGEVRTSQLDGLYQGSVGINYTFKNLRFIHAQMSANPPSVVPKPTSADREDRVAADAADRVMQFGRTHYKFQDVSDRRNLYTLLYGTGISKTRFNPDAGRPLEVDEGTGEVKMEGDIEKSVVDVWDFYIDPNATCISDIKRCFEKIRMDFDEAISVFGEENRELLTRYKRDYRETASNEDMHEGSALSSPKYNIVELYEFWETGLIENGYLGRFCICTEDGDPLTTCGPSPERYVPRAAAREKSKDIGTLPVAYLPYHILTDIDVPGRVWGKSFVEYAVAIQDNLNRLDNATLDNVKVHGVARLVTYGNSEINKEGSIVTTPMDVIKVDGNQKPDFVNPLPTPDIIPVLLARYKTGIDDTAGINEAMYGQQSRETSGFSMQYSVNQGNVIRFRLFNKYRAVTQDEFDYFLTIAANRWKTQKLVYVIGKENRFKSEYIQGLDIMCGYALSSEYGAAFSLDPTTRRDEMLALMPFFEKAGLDFRYLLKELKMHNIGDEYDVLDYAENRQQEIFDKIIQNRVYIEPIRGQDHVNMLKYAELYKMTAEFNELDGPQYMFRIDGPVKSLIMRHIDERVKLAAQDAQAGNPAEVAPQPGGAPVTAGGKGTPVLPPQNTGAAGAPADLTQQGQQPGLKLV